MPRRAASRSIGCSLVTAALLLAGGARAQAGTYDVWGCALADGTPAPADGWQPFQGHLGQTSNTCSLRGGSLGALLDNSTTAATEARTGWVFTAPSDVTIRSYTLYRWGRSEGTYERGRDYWLYNEAPYLDDRAYRFPQEVCSRFVGCQELGITGDPFAPFNRVDRRDLQIKQVYVVNQCHAADAAGCPPTSPASTFALYSARFELVDPHAPTFRGNPSGSLIQPGEVLTGERSVHLQAADLGSGLLWAGVTVDDQVQDSQPVDPNDRDCRPPTPGSCRAR